MKTLIIVSAFVLFPFLIQHKPIVASIVVHRVNEEEIETFKIVSYNTRGTCYHATAAQCDNTPFITADGSFIDTAKAHKLRWCAVSRDLIKSKKIRMGDTIHILSPFKEINGVWRVKDKMGAYFWKKIKLKDLDSLKEDIIENPHEFKMVKGRMCQKSYQNNWIDFLSHPKRGIRGSWPAEIYILKKTKKKINVIKC